MLTWGRNQALTNWNESPYYVLLATSKYAHHGNRISNYQFKRAIRDYILVLFYKRLLLSIIPSSPMQLLTFMLPLLQEDKKCSCK